MINVCQSFCILFTQYCRNDEWFSWYLLNFYPIGVDFWNSINYGLEGSFWSFLRLPNIRSPSQNVSKLIISDPWAQTTFIIKKYKIYSLQENPDILVCFCQYPKFSQWITAIQEVRYRFHLKSNYQSFHEWEQWFNVAMFGFKYLLDFHS